MINTDLGILNHLYWINSSYIRNLEIWIGNWKKYSRFSVILWSFQVSPPWNKYSKILRFDKKPFLLMITDYTQLDLTQKWRWKFCTSVTIWKRDIYVIRQKCSLSFTRSYNLGNDRKNLFCLMASIPFLRYKAGKLSSLLSKIQMAVASYL